MSFWRCLRSIMTKRQYHLDKLWQLIDNVYEAALDEKHWQNLAQQIARTFQSSSTSLLTQVGSESKLLSVTENVAKAMGDYQDYYWQKDVWVERAPPLVGISQVGTSRDMISDSEFEETEFYRDWCRHLGVFYVMGGVFPTGPKQLGVLGIHRPREAGIYEDNDTALVSRFLPHLQRALRIRDQLAQAALQRRVSVDTLDRCDTAALLVAADGLIVYANCHAEALLAEGSALCQRNGRLTGVRETENIRLSALIREAAGMAGSRSVDGIMALRRVNQQSLSALVSPFRLNWAGHPAAGAIVFVRDPNRSMSAIATLRALFRFTPTEARIAQALANGKTIAEIASAHRATLQTVRKQLKIIFAKTGTNRQAQCVAVILRSVATIARE
jgi:DNA-binding CsgD family transcriptional regulator